MQKWVTFNKFGKTEYWIKRITSNKMHNELTNWFNENYSMPKEIHSSNPAPNADQLFEELKDYPAVFYSSIVGVWNCIIIDPNIAAHFNLVWGE